jgi:MFS family permease
VGTLTDKPETHGATLDEATRGQIRGAHGRFAAMAATYGLGVFNDSFYRTSAMFLAVAVQMKYLQGWVMAVFTLPYLVIAAQAGWLADRFSKRHIVIGAKALEVVAMIFGAVGIVTGNWTLIFFMAFTMGAQSCLFSPALNGSIPELYPAAYVTKANATLKVVVTLMILLGVAVAGVIMDAKEPAWYDVPIGRWMVAGGVIAIALLGLAISFGVPHRGAADPSAPLPKAPFRETFRELGRIREDGLLAIVIGADVFVWFVGAMLIPLITVLGKEEIGNSEAMAGAMVAAELAGVAIGGVIGSRLAVGRRWYRVLPPAATALAVCLGLMPLVPGLPSSAQIPGVFVVLALVGIAGGMLMVPCEAFVQTRPGFGRKGRVIAAANFVVFAGIFVAGFAESGLNELLPASMCFGVLALASVPVVIWLWRVLGRGHLK